MKRLFTGLLTLAVLCAVIGSLLGLSMPQVFAAQKGLKGSGHIVSKTIDALDFQAIDASRSVKVIVTQTPQTGIRIDADDNVIDRVRVETVKGTLKVGIDPAVKSLSSVDVTVTVPAHAAIRALSASSAAKIRCENPLTADRIEIDASSAAKIEATVRTKKCSADASSASKIKLTGSADECSLEASSVAKIEAEIACEKCSIDGSSASKITLTGSAARCSAELSSASKLDASKFTVTACEIETTSASGARINCTETLQARASSGSSIRYSGKCRTEIRVSSGSSIRKND